MKPLIPFNRDFFDEKPIKRVCYKCKGTMLKQLKSGVWWCQQCGAINE